MKPPAFDYLRADTLGEALDALGEHGASAKIIAGGQSLMAMLNMRLVRPSVLIDISRVEELRSISLNGDHIEIGAAVTQAELAAWPELAAKAPLLARAIPHIGHFQTRNMGTVVGSLCHSDPSSELPLCLAVLGGEVVLQRGSRKRIVPAAEFQLDLLTTACGPDEMAVAARYPVARAGQGFAFREVARRHGDFAIVALAALADGSKVKLGVGGAAPVPAVREWDGLPDDGIAEALNAFAWELGGMDDIHASARYRRELVRKLGAQVITEARNARSA